MVSQDLQLKRNTVVVKQCYGLTPSSKQAPHSYLLTPAWKMERIGRVKVRKLMGWDKNSLITEKKKKSCTSNNSNNNNVIKRKRTERKIKFKKEKLCKWQQLLTTIWLMPTSQSLSSRLSSLPANFPSSFNAQPEAIWYGTSLGSVEVIIPAVSPPCYLCTPSLLAGGAV